MKKYWILILVLLAAFLFFYKLGVPTVWDNDEGQLLGSAVEMVKSHEFLTPHLNSAVYFHKPPLYAWLTSIVFSVFGFSEFWGRFWAAIFGIGGVFLTYKFGKRLFNERVGLISALVLLTTPLYIVLSKAALVDIVLCFFITLSLYFFYRGYESQSEKKWFYLMFASMALGTITKGPLGLVIPTLSILLFLVIERKLAFAFKMPLIKGGLIYLLVAAPWFILEAFREPSFLKIIFGVYLFTVYVTPLQQHPGPIYYYLLVVLFAMLPWSGFLISSFFKKPHALPLSVFLVMLAVFSTGATKVPGYFLPAFPFLAIIVGNYLNEVLAGKNKKGFIFGIVFTLMILLTAFLFLQSAIVPPLYVLAQAQLLSMIFVFLLLSLLALLLSFNPKISISILAAATYLFFVLLIGFLMPVFENTKYTPDFAKALKGEKNIGYYKTWLPPSFIYLLNRESYPTVVKELKDEKELKEFLLKNKKAYVLMTEDEVKNGRYKFIMIRAGYAIIGNVQLPISNDQ